MSATSAEPGASWTALPGIDHGFVVLPFQPISPKLDVVWASALSGSISERSVGVGARLAKRRFAVVPPAEAGVQRNA